MAKPEQGMWKYLRKRLLAWGHFVRVENDVEVGMPDVNFCIDGREGWLELKVWPRELERTQVVWALQRTAARGYVRVLVKDPIANDYFLLPVGIYDDIQRADDRPQLALSCEWSFKRTGWERLKGMITRQLRPDGTKI